MKAIIYTDGSMRNKVCAWAAHITLDKEQHLMSGPCPTFIKHSSQSETYAVLRAIQAVKALNPQVKQIEINTDFYTLKPRLEVKGKRTKEVISRTLQNKIVQEISSAEISLEIKFVRAHQKDDSCEQIYFNNLVDQAARKERRLSQEVQKIKKHTMKTKFKDFLIFMDFRFNHLFSIGSIF